MSHTVRCEPSGRHVTVHDGETLLTAIRRVGLPIGSSCDGDGVCGRCGVQILAGDEALDPQSAEEIAIKNANRVPPVDRLACKALVRGDVTVRARYW